jgi:hypothetical protein
MDKHGHPLSGLFFTTFTVSAASCVVPGCTDPIAVRRHRLCAKHYSAERRIFANIPPPRSIVRHVRGRCAVTRCMYREMEYPCTRGAWAQGLCKKHYARAWRRGEFSPTASIDVPAAVATTPFPLSMMGQETSDAMDCTQDGSDAAVASTTPSCDDASTDAPENCCDAHYTEEARKDPWSQFILRSAETPSPPSFFGS